MTPSQGKDSIIFIDGASSGNPGPGGWGALILTAQDRVVELGGGANPVTNNQMELLAALRALERLEEIAPNGAVDVYTDSKYLIEGVTKWIFGWQKNGWKTKEGRPVANSDIWVRLNEVHFRRKKRAPVRWNHVPGHSGVAGNERVDEIAVAFSKGRDPYLYDGTLKDYSLSDLRDTAKSAPMAVKKKKKDGPAYSYLSLVNGKAMRHSTWSECENRVKGMTAAKYRKTLSAEDEQAILEEWGVRNFK